MRIAVSGAHRTGKTTLIDELSRALPSYTVTEEPYYLLEEEGHEFAEMPSLEDFELQLARSIECVMDGAEDHLFDRSPADLLAYLVTHRDAGAFDLELWLRRARTAMQRLELIVFVPVESRVAVDEDELRDQVDDEIRSIVLEDRWAFEVEAIEVSGTVSDRARQVLARLER